MCLPFPAKDMKQIRGFKTQKQLADMVEAMDEFYAAKEQEVEKEEPTAGGGGPATSPPLG